MAGNFADNILELLRNKPCRLVLQREKKGLFLAAFKGFDPLPFSKLLDSFPVLNVLREHLDLRGSRVPVAFSVFPEVRRYLEIITSGLAAGLEIQIQPELARLAPGVAPDGFTLFYDWSVRSRCIVQRSYENIDYMGDGWYISGSVYWRPEAYESPDHKWLSSYMIQGSDILEFLTEAVPRWQKSDFPARCSVSYSDEPAVAIDINNVSDDEVDAFVEWNISSERIRSIPSLRGYVIVDGSTVMPGAMPQDLNRLVPDYSGPFCVKGLDIILFKDILLPNYRACLFGQVDELQEFKPHQSASAASAQDIPARGGKKPSGMSAACDSEQLPLFSFSSQQNNSYSPQWNNNFPSQWNNRSVPSSAPFNADRLFYPKTGSKDYALRFKREAEEFANLEGTPSDFVPFSSMQPDYDSMTEKQKSWYFWWRSCVRKNEYPDTDLSYLLLYCYELVNKVGARDASDACHKLYSLWTNYHGRCPRLANYLPLWLMDFIYINKCPADMLKLVQDASFPKNAGTADLLLYSFSLEQDLMLPVWIIDCLVDYDLCQGKFYQTPGKELSGKELIDRYLPSVVDRVDKHMQKKHGKRILDIFRPPESRLIRRLPFQGAIYYPEADAAAITIVPYTQYSPLRSFITNVVKHAENRLRAEAHFAGRFKSYTLDEEIKGLIDTYIDDLIAGQLQASPAVRSVTVDTDMVRRLIEDSDEIRDRLLEGLGDDGSDDTDSPAENSSTAGSKPGTNAREYNSDLPDEWKAFAARLDNIQMEALRILCCDSNADISAINAGLDRLCRDNLLMPEMLLDNINEAALDTVGDIIIDSSSEPPSVLEESLEMIKRLVIID